jgi:ribonuclease PH
VLIKSGETHVLCTASIEETVPQWRKDSGLGWVTAEYDMLPASTGERRARSRGKQIDGRAQEIQRLVGRSLRAIVDMKKLGARTIDDVTCSSRWRNHTAASPGTSIALMDLSACRKRLSNNQSPIPRRHRVGLVDGRPLLDLNYEEDKDAGVDFNVVQTGRGKFIEVQGTAEGGAFSRRDLSRIIALAEKGIRQLRMIQQRTLGSR